jgi:nicotinamide mononucleotide (NMN) deamidase PncC
MIVFAVVRVAAVVAAFAVAVSALAGDGGGRRQEAQGKVDHPAGPP